MLLALSSGCFFYLRDYSLRDSEIKPIAAYANVSYQFRLKFNPLIDFPNWPFNTINGWIVRTEKKLQSLPYTNSDKSAGG